MSEQRIIQLLTRKMAGEASEEELEELEILQAMFPDISYQEELLQYVWQNSTESEDDQAAELAFEAHRIRFLDDFTKAELAETADAVEMEYVIAPADRNRKLYYWAAAAILTGFTVFLFWQDSPSNGTDQQIIASTTRIETAKGARKKITLPDSTLVWLNSDTHLSYDENMNEGKQRMVKLSGEAYFDVAHNKDRPFIITTDKVSIRVLGTAFNVKAYPKDSITETALIRGLVELTVRDRPAQKIVLRPSEKVSIVENKQTKEPGRTLQSKAFDRKLILEDIKEVAIGEVAVVQETSWTNDMLVFKNELFEEMVPRLERWYNITIEIRTDKLRKRRFTGIFKEEPLEAALEALQLIEPFRYRINEERLVLIE
ncbi:FecR family protein [Flavihumibacter sp. UBA7668]|uniref:FecR family protein n=1 Tax=Flavihumibacter sp. UBA7668 TaxID=1946542 RepID=UPI0025B90762|nr:FecR domain-containing protein [Flavihumibacter sp. UBA7668]